MEEIVTQNYDAWNAMAKSVAYVAWAVSILIVIYHVIRLATINDAKVKYDYINRSEIRTLWIAAIILIVGCCFYANSNIQKLNTLWIFVLGFTTFAMGMIVALIIQNMLKFYYPFFIEKRLKALRYKPRVSPKTGKAMKLLGESEEDAYLDEGMQAEEMCSLLTTMFGKMKRPDMLRLNVTLVTSTHYSALNATIKHLKWLEKKF